MAKSAAEEAFLAAWQSGGLDGSDMQREYRWHPMRKWRFDFAFPSQKLAIEIDGRGRHQTVVGVRQDCEKLNEAILHGWRVLRFPATDKRMAAEWVDQVVRVLADNSIQAL